MAANNYFALLMAGGIGSRFWPESTPEQPKQFLDLFNVGRSLLQQTYERIRLIVPHEHIYILTAAEYKEQIRQHLPDLLPEQIICEPIQRNTAPCNLVGALKIHALNPEAKILVAPTDHLIHDTAAFKTDVTQAFELTNDNNLITFGVQPEYPATGYGYIQRNDKNQMSTVVTFKEKPSYALANQYVQSGNYLWNAGIFVWSTKAILSAFKKFEPQMFAAMTPTNHVWQSSSDQDFIDREFSKLTNISIDYAILERSNSVYVIQASFDWNDLGSWSALYKEMEKDIHGNVSIQGDLFADSSKNNLIKTQPGKKVLLVGLEDYIVLEKEDTLVIVPKSKDQLFKQYSKAAQKHWDKS